MNPKIELARIAVLSFCLGQNALFAAGPLAELPQVTPSEHILYGSERLGSYITATCPYCLYAKGFYLPEMERSLSSLPPAERDTTVEQVICEWEHSLVAQDMDKLARLWLGSAGEAYARQNYHHPEITFDRTKGPPENDIRFVAKIVIEDVAVIATAGPNPDRDHEFPFFQTLVKTDEGYRFYAPDPTHTDKAMQFGQAFIGAPDVAPGHKIGSVPILVHWAVGPPAKHRASVDLHVRIADPIPIQVLDFSNTLFEAFRSGSDRQVLSLWDADSQAEVNDWLSNANGHEYFGDLRTACRSGSPKLLYCIEGDDFDYIAFTAEMPVFASMTRPSPASEAPATRPANEPRLFIVRCARSAARLALDWHDAPEASIGDMLLLDGGPVAPGPSAVAVDIAEQVLEHSKQR